MNGGAASAVLTSFTAVFTDGGTSCGDLATATVSWTVNASVVDGSHDLRIYRTRAGIRALIYTEVSPASNLSYVDDLENFEDVGSGIFYVYAYDYELIAAGPTVIDSGAAPEPVTVEMNADVCPG